MLDRFKFKCWDKEEKRFLHYLSFYISPNGILMIQKGMEGRKYIDINNDRYILIQSIGRKDKNNNLIYEGDILNLPWFRPCYVYLNIGECGLCRGDSVSQYILSYDIEEPKRNVIYNIWNGREVEIIGNIYENPEILKVGKYEQVGNNN